MPLKNLLGSIVRPTLRVTLAEFGAGMVLLTGLGVAAVAYINAQATVSQLTLEIFDAKVSATEQRAVDYAATAHATLVSTRRLLETGALPDEPDALVDCLLQILRSTPRISILTIGLASGDATWVARDLDGSIRIYRYTGVGGPEPRHRVYRVDGDERILEVDEASTYDARTRPWFQVGLEARDQPRWTEPYLFIPENKPGISLAQRLELDGEMAGVMTVDFRLDFLSRGLRELDQGYGTEGVIFDAQGFVIGHSDERHIRRADTSDVAMLRDHPDPALRVLSTLDLDRADERSVIQTRIAGEDYAMAVHAPDRGDEGAPSWWTAVIIPESALLRDVRTQALYGILVALMFLGLAGLTSIALSRRITRSFYGFYEEMERVGRLELKPWNREPTRIAEMERLGEQLENLKTGLESFSRYVPIDLVRTLLADGQKAEVGGQTREVSVYFSDIAGFTTTVEKTPPAEFLPALSGYLNQATGAISETGGNVVSFMGDGLMAVFGAPIATEGHAADACRGALLARDRARALVEQAQATGGPEFPTRYGINTGPALVGNIGATDRFDYSAIGDTTNTAARLEGLNKQYGTEILVGPTTRREAGDAFVFRRVDRVRMKGKRVPLVVYELIGEAGRVPEAILSGIVAYEEALEAYWARDFEAARAGFERCGELLGGDAPSRTMVATCRHFLTEPPPEDWDGTRDVLEK